MRNGLPIPGALVTALLATAGLAVALPATAKPMEEIVVGAPHKTTVGRTTTGIPITQIAVRSRVRYGDLDLTSRAGAAALENRIREAARTSCRSIDAQLPLDRSSDRSCMRHAVDGAMLQARAAMAAERKARPG